MTDRATFLTRIGEALGRRPRDPVPPPPALDEALVRRVEDSDAKVERFLAEVVAAGGEAIDAPAGVLPATIGARLSELGVTEVTLDLEAERLGLGEACARVGLTPVPPEGAVQPDAGITGATRAIAETGTVVLDASRGNPRGVSLRPRIHVAVVLESRIVPDLVDALRGSDAMPSARTWVTGPSKTADIEGILVTGVHGPETWIVAVARGA